MNDDLQVSVFGMIAALVGVVVVMVALRMTSWLVAAVPMPQARRSALRRGGPVIAGVVGVAYAMLAARVVFRGAALASNLAALAVIGIVLGLSWFALRDLVAGMFWKAGSACQPGDSIRIDGVTGRVTRLGFRVLGVETEQGDSVFVPYSRLQRETLAVSRQQFGESRHVFEVQIPTDRPASEIERTVTRLALLCHGTSLARRPRVRQVALDRLEVTVFALWSEPVSDLEFRIRRAIGKENEKWT